LFYILGGCQIHYRSISSYKKNNDEDLISFILGGLNQEYNSFITSFNFVSKDNEFTFEDFSTQS
jgi:hypothetical protein